MTTYLYRVTVDEWPTEYGDAWPRWYGFNTYGVGPDQEYDEEPPEWVLAQRDNPLVASRFRCDLDGNFLGVLMPRTSRKHYLSGSTAARLVEHMRAFGAVVRLERSQPVQF